MWRARLDGDHMLRRRLLLRRAESMAFYVRAELRNNCDDGGPGDNGKPDNGGADDHGGADNSGTDHHAGPVNCGAAVHNGRRWRMLRSVGDLRWRRLEGTHVLRRRPHVQFHQQVDFAVRVCDGRCMCDGLGAVRWR